MAVKVKPVNAGWMLAALYAAGIVAFSFPQTSSIARQLIWPVLVLTCLVLLAFHKKWTREFTVSVFLIAFMGFLIDVLAVKTGFIFGYFQYGSTLGFKFWETPLSLMAFWVTMVYCSRQIAEMVAKDTFVVSILAAALMLLLDYFVEPFAIRYGLWSWNEGATPLHNYMGLGISALVMQYIYCKSLKIPANKLSLVIYLIQLGFFITLFFLKRS
jgi:uncharacterized membrane protein